MPPAAAAARIPDAVYRWYHSSYPTLSFNPDWLQACVDYLLEYDPVAQASVPGLIKAIEVQLLSSDLATSVIPPSTDSSFLQVKNPPSPDPPEPRRVLFRAPPNQNKTSNKNKKAGGNAVLVQIVQVDDVAHSALSLEETLKEKKEARRTLAAKGARGGGGGAGGGGDGGRIMDLNDNDQSDDLDLDLDLDAEAKRRALHHGGQGADGPSFPRGSGRFVLTDGGPAQWTAFELQRIAGLGLEEELKLGTKLLIHDVPCINGILMLTPQNTIVKGFQVEELDSVREWYFENAFRNRLGLEPLPDPRGGGGGGAPETNIEPPHPPQPPPAPAAAAARPPARSNNHHAPPQQARRQPKQQQQKAAAEDEEEDYFGDDFDLDLADFERADQLAREAAAARGLKANDRMNHDGNDDDDDDEEEALREIRRLEESAANFKPGPTPSPHKPPPQPPQLKSERSSSSTSTLGQRQRQGGGGGVGSGGGGGGGRTTMAMKSSGVSGGGVEVLDLDDDDDDDELGSGKRREEKEQKEEDIKPVRKKVKAEEFPVQADRRRGDEPPPPPPRGGTRGRPRTVIEIEDSD